ncbi:hypothetical protein N7492_000658 [Penicillium capsulatum]|uniref:Uncharacterized protein n=1 Tax=Penicillium capsulatum TaxID=69766 RepID=A0A9W9ISC1_9EURO|nr:hypothetical protein N7492_000658 [Penicillium capsulatum]KAJ6130283.1 hypothetical protein N7512_003063 [Penicillium capsulatum]
MRAHALLATGALFALATESDALPSNSSLAKRNMMMFRRDQLLGGQDHSLMRRENVKDRYEFFCDYENRNSFQWNKVGMGNQLKIESNMFYDDGPCSDGPYGAFGSKTFPEAIHSQIEGYGGWGGCTMKKCEVSWDDDMCKKDDDNPMWLYFLQAISNYAATMVRMREEIEWGFANASTIIDYIVSDFSTHPKDTEPNPASAAIILISSIMGGASAAMGPFSPAGSAAAGTLGGLIGVGNGILSTAKKTNPAKQVQAELDRQGVMKKSLEKITTSMKDAVKSWGEDLIEGKVDPQNDPYKSNWYSAQKRSLPSLLANGDFAENPHEKVTSDISKAISTYSAYGALTYTWQQEKVFIAKVHGDVDGTHVCDIDLSKGGVAKEKTLCEGGVLYLFHKVKTESTGLHFTIDTPDGIDKLEDDLGVNKKDLIDAAIAAQKSAGYVKKYTIDEAIYRTGLDDGEKFVSIPVCDLNDGWTNHQGAMSMVTPPAWQKIYWNVANCASKKDQKGNEFPYSINQDFYR